MYSVGLLVCWFWFCCCAGDRKWLLMLAMVSLLPNKQLVLVALFILDSVWATSLLKTGRWNSGCYCNIELNFTLTATLFWSFWFSLLNCHEWIFEGLLHQWFQRSGVREGVNRTVGPGTLISSRCWLRWVGPACWTLPKPIYNVTDKQVDHSSLLPFFFFLLLLLFHGASCWHRFGGVIIYFILKGSVPPSHPSEPSVLMELLMNGTVEWLGLELDTWVRSRRIWCLSPSP